MLSLSAEYYQIFLSQGIGFGIGAGVTFTTCFVLSGQWFVKRRGLTLSILSTAFGRFLTIFRLLHCQPAFTVSFHLPYLHQVRFAHISVYQSC